MLEIFIFLFVIISLLVLIFVLINNKFQLALVKMEKADDDIGLHLQRKKELLERAKPIIKKELKKKEFLMDLEIEDEDQDNFMRLSLLKKIYNELFKIIDENEKLLKSENLVSILEDLNDNEEGIIGSIKFYNDTVVSYNHLVVSFPSNIIALIRRYKKVDFYNNEKREMFEILNK